VVEEFINCGVNINENILIYENGEWIISNYTAIDLLVAYSNVSNESLNLVIACLVENGATVRDNLSFQLILIPQVREAIFMNPKLATKVILSALIFSK